VLFCYFILTSLLRCITHANVRDVFWATRYSHNLNSVKRSGKLFKRESEISRSPIFFARSAREIVSLKRTRYSIEACITYSTDLGLSMGGTRGGAWEIAAPCALSLASRLPLRRNVDSDKVLFGNHRYAKM